MSKYMYSVVIDGVESHKQKLHILLTTLTKLANVPATEIVVHCTTRVDIDFMEAVQQAGYLVNSVEPYLDGKYCNKLRQLDYFASKAPLDLRGVYLLDVDIAVVLPLAVQDDTQVWGKIVDAPNPPLSVLSRIFESAQISLPKVVSCDWNVGPTIESNLNGGFYYVPRGQIEQLSNSWRAWAEYLFNNQDLFETDIQRIHIDQVAFAMAVCERNIQFNHLPANSNFPCHANIVPISYNANEPIAVLHYHDCLDSFGTINPRTTSLPAVGEAVRKVADIMAVHPQFSVHHSNLSAELRSLSIQQLGFFPETVTRGFEYPWFAQRMLDCSGKRALDVGAGLNVLPFWLAEQGAEVVTLDNHPLHRELSAKHLWNEWGFLDYGHIDPRIQSYNQSIVGYSPEQSFQLVYSVSVIEHMPRRIREAAIVEMARLTADSGILLLSVDLIPNTDLLWNMSEGEIVDSDTAHGTVTDLLTELSNSGFSLQEYSVLREINGSRTDVAFIAAKMRRA